MPRRQLLRRLEALSPPSAASSFVLLWTYFRQVGLDTAENALRADDDHPLKLEPYPEDRIYRPASLSAAIRRLGDLVERPPDLDVLALRWLKGLDLFLKDRFEEQLDGEFRGADGELYALRRWNHLIARHYEDRGQGITWAAHQSLAIEAYARYHRAVPLGPVEGRRIEILPQTEWGTPSLHDRLNREKTKLRIMCWPFATEIVYADVGAAGDPRGRDPTIPSSSA